MSDEINSKFVAIKQEITTLNNANSSRFYEESLRYLKKAERGFNRHAQYEENLRRKAEKDEADKERAVTREAKRVERAEAHKARAQKEADEAVKRAKEAAEKV